MAVGVLFLTVFFSLCMSQDKDMGEEEVEEAVAPLAKVNGNMPDIWMLHKDANRLSSAKHARSSNCLCLSRSSVEIWKKCSSAYLFRNMPVVSLEDAILCCQKCPSS